MQSGGGRGVYPRGNRIIEPNKHTLYNTLYYTYRYISIPHAFRSSVPITFIRSAVNYFLLQNDRTNNTTFVRRSTTFICHPIVSDLPKLNLFFFCSNYRSHVQCTYSARIVPRSIIFFVLLWLKNCVHANIASLFARNVHTVCVGMFVVYIRSYWSRPIFQCCRMHQYFNNTACTLMRVNLLNGRLFESKRVHSALFSVLHQSLVFETDFSSLSTKKKKKTIYTPTTSS